VSSDGNSASSDRDRSQRDTRRGCGCGVLAGLLGTAVTAAGLLWTMVNVDYMRTWACDDRRVLENTDTLGYCDGFGPVTARVAELTFDEYLRNAAGADPMRGWERLAPRERDDVEQEQFMSEWEGVLFAELRGRAEPTGERNRFILTYQVWYGANNEAATGQVAYLKQEVQFVDLGPEVLLLDREPRVPDGAAEVSYPPLRLLPGTTTRQAPTHDSQYVASTEGAGGISAGGMLRSICQASVGPDWWSRTPLGWLEHAQTQTGNIPASEGYLCDPHHALEVIQAANIPGEVPSSEP